MLFSRDFMNYSAYHPILFILCRNAITLKVNYFSVYYHHPYAMDILQYKGKTRVAFKQSSTVDRIFMWNNQNCHSNQIALFKYDKTAYGSHLYTEHPYKSN